MVMDMSTSIELETNIMLQRMVRDACMKVLGRLGGYYHLSLEFAKRYYQAMKKNDIMLMKDIREVYKSFGVPEPLMKEIIKRIEERYKK